jgi:hypothetical protein
MFKRIVAYLALEIIFRNWVIRMPLAVLPVPSIAQFTARRALHGNGSSVDVLYYSTVQVTNLLKRNSNEYVRKLLRLDANGGSDFKVRPRHEVF